MLHVLGWEGVVGYFFELPFSKYEIGIVWIDPALLVDVDNRSKERQPQKHFEPGQFPEAALTIVRQLVQVCCVPLVQIIPLKILIWFDWRDFGLFCRILILPDFGRTLSPPRRLFTPCFSGRICTFFVFWEVEDLSRRFLIWHFWKNGWWVLEWNYCLNLLKLNQL